MKTGHCLTGVGWIAFLPKQYPPRESGKTDWVKLHRPSGEARQLSRWVSSMRRFIFLLFLFMTVLQPAFSGMPELAAPSAPALSAEVSAEHAAGCSSHVEAASPGAPAGCASGQPCGLCSLCQACHQAVMSESQVAAPGHVATRPSFPLPASGYFSAERAQSFKPPIL